MSLPEFIFERVTADVRQQMAGVAALAEQLRRHRLPDDAEACVSSISAAAISVRRTLEAAIDLKSVVVKGLVTQPEPLRLRELMDELQARWQAPAAGPPLRLLVSYDGDPEAAVMGDRMRLLQVFDGLIGEAVGARQTGTVEASLHARADGGAVVLQGRVRGDRPPAAEAETLEARIRAIADRLGLDVALSAMLARRILAGLGGELQHEENAGASETTGFELRLPAVQAAPVAGPQTARAAHILVVDDNATNRMVAQSLVEMFDCTSEAAEDGLEAIEAVRSGRFDLILMDIRMPEMDGVAATRAIRAMGGAIGQTPIIALTANADPEDAAAYLAAGMNGVVEKPMKPEHLLAALQQALGEAAAQAA